MSLTPEFLQHPDAWRDEAIYKEIYEYSISNPFEYWAAQINRLMWSKLPQKIKQKSPNGATLWFPDGELNACVNCVDRYANSTPQKTALIFQSEGKNDLGPHRYYSFKKLKEEVCRFANTLNKFGLTRQDCITIYMPMVPEAVFACLACARLGIKYSVVFAGFSPAALAIRMEGSKSRFIITVDGSVRAGKVLNLKQNLDEARQLLNFEVRALIIKRQNLSISWDTSIDFDYYAESENMPTDCPPAPTKSTDPLFCLYTSGSAGKPKGTVMSTAGFLLFSMITGKYFFNMFDNEIFWGSGDIGWMGGHAYALYAALCNGITTVFYEGMPTYPRKSIFWEIIDKFKITSFNTAPTALRAMMQNAQESLSNTIRKSLKYLGVFGEILNKEVWEWYFNEVGQKRCPIVNMWGQTELGGVPTAPLSNLTDMKTYGHIGRQFFGCKLVLEDDNGEVITTPYRKGTLFLDLPLPGMLIDVIGEDLQKMYYSKSKSGRYCAGDEAYFDENGNFWISGRNDDVLNVSGHRISPIEIEESISKLDDVAEVSVVGCPHKIKGEGICAFIVLTKAGLMKDSALCKDNINRQVNSEISPITRPDIIFIVPDLPKTRSGKILKRILRRLARQEDCQNEDLSMIQNPESIEAIKTIVGGLTSQK